MHQIITDTDLAGAVAGKKTEMDMVMIISRPGEDDALVFSLNIFPKKIRPTVVYLVRTGMFGPVLEELLRKKIKEIEETKNGHKLRTTP